MVLSCNYYNDLIGLKGWRLRPSFPRRPKKATAMLEKFGVHILPFLGAGGGAGNISSKVRTADINTADDNFFKVADSLPQSMALVLVLAQDCNVPVQQQTNTRGILIIFWENAWLVQ